MTSEAAQIVGDAQGQDGGIPAFNLFNLLDVIRGEAYRHNILEEICKCALGKDKIDGLKATTSLKFNDLCVSTKKGCISNYKALNEAIKDVNFDTVDFERLSTNCRSKNIAENVLALAALSNSDPNNDLQRLFDGQDYGKLILRALSMSLDNTVLTKSRVPFLSRANDEEGRRKLLAMLGAAAVGAATALPNSDPKAEAGSGAGGKAGGKAGGNACGKAGGDAGGKAGGKPKQDKKRHKAKAAATAVLPAAPAAQSAHAAYTTTDAPSSAFARIKPGSHVPSSLNPNEMVDRQLLLPMIKKALQDNARPVYLHSFGGLGKTTVAQAFCADEECLDGYDYVFWVDATDSGGDIRRDILSAKSIGFRFEEGADVDAAYKTFIIQSRDLPGEALLVIDNVASPEQMLRCEAVAKDLGWRVLVTSRADMNNAAISRRTIKVEELDDEYCERLFADNYYDERDAAVPEEDKEYLCKIFRMLGKHTTLIKLVASAGYKRHTVRQLHDMLAVKGCFHQGLDVTVLNADRYDSLHKQIRTLYDMSGLTTDEAVALKCFAMLPDSPLPAAVVTEWLKGGPLPSEDAELRRILDSLADKSYLIREYDKDKGLAYKCHNIIQVALRDDAPNAVPETLYANMARFFTVEDGMPYYHLVPYLDCAESVLERTRQSTPASLKLMAEFVYLLHRRGSSPDLEYKYAKRLKDEYESVADKTDEHEWQVGLCKALGSYAAAYMYGPGNKNNASQSELYKGAYEKAVEFFGADDIWSLRYQRLYADSLGSAPGRLSESIEALEDVIERLQKINKGEGQEQRRIDCGLMLAFGDLGICWHKAARAARYNEDMVQHEVCIIKAIAARKLRLDLAVSCYGNDEDALVFAHNDLGMGLLEYYETHGNDELLNEAEGYLSKSLKNRKRIYGENCEATANAKGNYAKLLRLQGNPAESLRFALESLETRKSFLKPSDRKWIIVRRRVAAAHYDLFCRDRNPEDLENAKRYIDEALHCEDNLHGQPDFLSAKLLRDKIYGT
jgi:hypothetical protein